MDKGYYDYDYSEPKSRRKQAAKPKTARQMSSVLERFGFKTRLQDNESGQLTAEQLQAEVMREEESKHCNN